VNTRFSNLSLINDDYSFECKWIPKFITDQTPDDRCHLNGMAMKDGKPKYVTALGTTNSAKAWRENIQFGGVLIDVDTNEIVVKGLPMPHSPRLFGGNLYALCSATGQVIKIDVNKGTYDTVCKLQGFLRGMCLRGDVLFVGLSKLRQNASTFRDLPIARESIFCGVVAIHLLTGNQIGFIKYENSVEEIYDIQFLEGVRRPAILNTLRDEHRRGLVTNTDAFWSSEEPSNQNEQVVQNT
ncbi:MAG: TIGR03032 family protein, partial [Cytophagales bacterium]